MNEPICVLCAPDLKCVIDDPLKYSLQEDFGLVLYCPPSYDCSASRQVRLTCCSQELVATFPPGATQTQRGIIIRALLAKCAKLEEFCGGPVTSKYANKEIKYKSDCAPPNPADPGANPGDGSTSTGAYSYVIPAGTFYAASQAIADALARSYAATFGQAHKFCVKVPGLCPCVGDPAVYDIRIVGGDAPFTPVILSGHLPASFEFFYTNRAPHDILLRGTPTTPGRYRFVLTVLDRFGGTAKSTQVLNALMIGYKTTFGVYLTPEFIIPAVGDENVAIFASVDNLAALAIVRVGNVDALGITTGEYGSFQVTALDTPPSTLLLLKNLTATEGATIPEGAVAYWALATLPIFHNLLPYSFQLPAVGGSGSYAWRLIGDLPDGLTLSVSGLISGTPTGTAGTTFSVELIDTTCQEVDRTFFRPAVKLVGRSHTIVASVWGFDEFQTASPSVPRKRYRRRTLVGLMEGLDARDRPVTPFEGVSYAYYSSVGFLGNRAKIYEGFVLVNDYDEINFLGVLTHPAKHANVAYCTSPFESTYPLSICVPHGIAKSTFSTTELLLFGGLLGPIATVLSKTSAVVTSPDESNITQPDQYLKQKVHYSIVLSNEFTDEDALTNAVETDGTKLKAETTPRTTGFVSTWTSVQYDLQLSNLVFGEAYVATVDHVDQAGLVLTQAHRFTATGRTHVITDNLPTPANGHTLTATNARVTFAF